MRINLYSQKSLLKSSFYQLFCFYFILFFESFIIAQGFMGQKSSSTVLKHKSPQVVTNHVTNQMSSETTCPSLLERKKAALFGLYVGDAVAMPVHWMYNLANLRRDYGRITGYVKPKDYFEGSIMNLSNTGGGGRGGDQGEIIGSVINHGKKKYWVRGGNFHYHLGLDAGENTLEAQLTRLATRCITEKGSFNQNDYLEKYVKFMTTPGSHNDTYAATAHRMFFANFIKGIPPNQCADNDGHNTDAIDGLTAIIPVIVRYSEVSREERNAKINEMIQSMRKSRVLPRFAESYADILVDVLHGGDLKEAIATHDITRSAVRLAQQSSSDPMTACYIDSAFPALLYFAYKYGDSVEQAVLANANAGGENVARGSALGALLGAAHGMNGFPAWTHELKEKEAIFSEIDSFVNSF